MFLREDHHYIPWETKTVFTSAQGWLLPKSVLSDKPMIFHVIDFAYCSTESEQAQESYTDLVFLIFV